MDSAYNSPSLKRVGICICLCVYVIISRLSLTPNICLLDIWHPHRTSCYGTNRGMQQKQPKRKDASILLFLRKMCSPRQSKIDMGKFWHYPAALASSQFNTMKFPRFLLALLLFLQSGRMTFYPFIRLEREAKKSTVPFLSINFPSFPFFFIFCGELSVYYCNIKVELGQNLNIKVVNENGNYLKKSHQHITGFECY